MPYPKTGDGDTVVVSVRYQISTAALPPSPSLSDGPPSLIHIIMDPLSRHRGPFDKLTGQFDLARNLDKV